METIKKPFAFNVPVASKKLGYAMINHYPSLALETIYRPYYVHVGSEVVVQEISVYI